MVTKDQIRAAFALKRDVVEVGGHTLGIREPSAADITFASQDDNAQFNQRIFARCVVDENGGRVYTDDDAGDICAEYAQRFVADVAVAIVELSNPNSSVGKLSGETDGSSSPTDSPSS